MGGPSRNNDPHWAPQLSAFTSGDAHNGCRALFNGTAGWAYFGPAGEIDEGALPAGTVSYPYNLKGDKNGLFGMTASGSGSGGGGGGASQAAKKPGDDLSRKSNEMRGVYFDAQDLAHLVRGCAGDGDDDDDDDDPAEFGGGCCERGGGGEEEEGRPRKGRPIVLTLQAILAATTPTAAAAVVAADDETAADGAAAAAATAGGGGGGGAVSRIGWWLRWATSGSGEGGVYPAAEAAGGDGLETRSGADGWEVVVSSAPAAAAAAGIAANASGDAAHQRRGGSSGGGGNDEGGSWSHFAGEEDKADTRFDKDGGDDDANAAAPQSVSPNVPRSFRDTLMAGAAAGFSDPKALSRSRAAAAARSPLSSSGGASSPTLVDGGEQGGAVFLWRKAAAGQGECRW